MLQRVYYEQPTGGASPWFQITENRGPQVASLELGTDDAGHFWRAVYRSNLWLDANHASPGFGYLGIMAAAESGAKTGPSAVIGDQPYDLTGARFSCEIRANVDGGGLRLGKNVRIIFWIQFRDECANMAEGRYVNLGYIAKPIDRLLGFTSPFERAAQETKSSGFVLFKVTFDPSNSADWVQYGTRTANRDRSDTYGNANSLGQVFRNWGCNLGFHAIYGQTAPAPGDLPYGQLDFRHLKLEVDDVVNDLTGKADGQSRRAFENVEREAELRTNPEPSREPPEA